MSRICDCSQIQLRRAKNHNCSATARRLFFFLGCLFFGQSKDTRTAQGFADALDTRGRLYPHVICSFCAQASEGEVNHFQEGEYG